MGDEFYKMTRFLISRGVVRSELRMTSKETREARLLGMWGRVYIKSAFSETART